MPSDGDPLAMQAMEPEQMRQLGYRVVDLLVDHEAGASRRFPVSRARRPSASSAAVLPRAWLEREPFLQDVTGHPQSRAAAETAV